ncbi:hypothetical protein GGD41_006110 [Paraburkholderia bryophila]|uniref:Uncharacterized protein n=1 Tax=Paraburkholderia bryophila TaxID=420952 RepID=A0A7Y9WDI2_9BURK|nr:hypothetical protein [Paraburkholderia bryophila]
MDKTSHHVWTGNSICLISQLRHRTRTSERNVIIDFDFLGIARGGLLDACLEDAPVPLSINYGAALKRVLKGAAKNASLSSILGAPVNQLYPWQIDALFAGFEDEIEKWHVTSSLTLSSQARHVFKHCRQKLADGTNVSECGFTTRFASPLRTSTLPLAESFYDAFDSQKLAEPLSAIEFETRSDLDNRALAHLQIRLEKLLELCESIVDEYLALQEILRRTAELPPPTQLTPKMRSEPPRIWWRLQLLREWSHEQVEQIFC